MRSLTEIDLEFVSPNEFTSSVRSILRTYLDRVEDLADNFNKRLDQMLRVEEASQLHYLGHDLTELARELVYKRNTILKDLLPSFTLRHPIYSPVYSVDSSAVQNYLEEAEENFDKSKSNNTLAGAALFTLVGGPLGAPIGALFGNATTGSFDKGKGLVKALKTYWQEETHSFFKEFYKRECDMINNLDDEIEDYRLRIQPYA